jgi:hypothetical protein
LLSRLDLLPMSHKNPVVDINQPRRKKDPLFSLSESPLFSFARWRF